MSGPTLFEITGEIKDLLAQLVDEETGEVNEDVEQQLKELDVTLDEKLLAYAHFIKNQRIMFEAVSLEQRRLARYKKQLANSVEWALKSLEMNTPDEEKKLRKTPTAEIGWRTVNVVVADNPPDDDPLKFVPRGCITEKPATYSINKDLAKAYMNTGLKIMGWKLLTKKIPLVK